MRNVSELYNTAIISPELHTSISGTIKTAGRTYDITDKIVIPGSLSINRKAINRSSFEYGAAVTSEMNISLILPDADRYALYNAVVVLYIHTLLSDGSEETLKLGTWNVSECTKTKKIVQIKGYDNMLLFDTDITDDTTGTVYALLALACEKCGVELSQAEEEISALVNGAMQIRVRADEVDTYRDLICYIGMITCTFAMIDYGGKLTLRTFGKASSDNIIKRQVMSSKISDFKSSYKGVTARFIADTNYAPYEVVDDTLTGLVLDMGDIPIVRGLPETKTEVLNNILADLKGIIYTPVELSITGNPALEPGDMVTVKNANLTEDDVVTLITSTTWNYHGQMKVVSAGSNPRLASAKDRSTKQIRSVENTVVNKDVIILSYVNADTYTINQMLVEIVDISYTVFTGCKPVFIMTVQFELDVDGYVEFTLYNGLVAIEHATYTGYYQAGKHFATIFFPDTTAEDERKNIRVLARAYKNEASIVRQQAADIKTLNNAIAAIKTSSDLSSLAYTVETADTTEPTLTIAAEELKAIIWAQGIGSKAEWDGDLEFTDAIDVAEICGMSMSEFNDVISTWLDAPKTSVITEEMPSIGMEGMTVLSYNSNIGFNEVIEQYIVDTSRAGQYIYESKYVDISDGFRLQNNYYMQGEYDESGIATIELDTTIYQTVSGIEIDTDTGAKYLLYAGGVYYDSELSVINIDAVTPDAMMEYGSDAWTADLTAYSSCKLFKYNTSEARIPLSATIDAEPYAQTIQTDAIDLSNPTITGIEYVTVDAAGAPTFAVSFDAGTTWMMHSGTAWVELSAEESGMQVSTFIAITTEQWAEQTVGIDDVRLKISLTGMNDVVRSIVIDYTN